MSNFFAEEAAATPQPANSFSDTLASMPVDAQEQDVIHNTNNPLKETPASFGLVDIPVETIKGLGNAIATIPASVGQNIAETGELTQGMKGQSTSEVVIKSLAGRFAEATSNGKTPGLFGTAKILFGVEKDALLSLFSDGTTPKVIQNAGNAMIEQNQAAISALGLTPKGGTDVAFDIGNAFGQVSISVALNMVRKSPALATAYMSSLINSQDYQEARKAGKEPEEAAQIAGASTYGQGLLEFMGGKIFIAATAGSSFFRKVLFRAAEQGAEESSQQVVEEGVMGASGVRNTPLSEKIYNVLYAGAIGVIVGAPVSAIATKMESAGKEADLPPEKTQELTDKLIQNKAQVIDAATVLIDKETAGVTNNEPAHTEALKAVKQVFTDQTQVDEATAVGSTEDPKIAAKILLQSPHTSEETKAAILGLGENFTMEQLHNVANNQKSDVALAEALALEEKHNQTLQGNLDRWREMTSSVRENTAMTKRQIKETQTQLLDFINKSGLSAEDKAKFLSTIKNTQTATQLVSNIDDVENRINALLDESRRRAAVAKIKNTLAKSQQSTVAVDFSQQVEALANKVDTTKRTDGTRNSLKKTLDYLQNNPGAEIPKSVRNKLEILNKKPIDQVTTQELEDLANQMAELVKQGKTKQALLESKKERLKQQRIEELQKESTPLSNTDLARARIGERLAVMDKIKNRFIELSNAARRKGRATNPMDVFFDMLDGGKSYKGANYRIFKKTIDESFSRYLNLKEKSTRAVKTLTDKLDLNEQNFEKIGAWAVLQQEGGEKKLLNSGIPQEELDALELTKPEMQMYQLMRKKLDEMLPAIQDVMRHVYNKEVNGVKDYFPFMTDFEAMHDFEIQDQIGDQTPQIGQKKNVERGFTEKRTGGKQNIRIDALGVFFKHIDNAAYLIEMGNDIKSLGDVASSKEYKKAIGDIGQDMVKEWIDLLARNGKSRDRIAWLDMMRKNAGLAVLGFKLSSAAVQFTSLADAQALIGNTYVAQGVKNIATKEWRQFIWDNMPEVRERVGDDPSYLDMGGNGIVAKTREAGFYVLKKIDGMVASASAAGAYIKSVEERGGTVDLSKPDPVAIQEAQLMMRRTQSSPFAKDAPSILTQGELTGNVSVDKLLGQFQSFMLNRWSLIKHDMWELGVKQGNTKQALNIATWLILATAAEVGLRRLVKDAIDTITNNKKPPTSTVTHDMTVNLLQNIPIVSQAVSAFEYGSVPVPAFSVMARGFDEFKNAAQSKTTETKMRHYEKAAIIVLGAGFGIPGTMQATQLLNKPKQGKSASSTP